MSSSNSYPPVEDEKSAAPLAVALQYDPQNGAPRVVAKGRGEIAEKIIETAQKHNVVIESNPLLAQALSRVALEREIPVALYQAVAEILKFILQAGRSRPL